MTRLHNLTAAPQDNAAAYRAESREAVDHRDIIVVSSAVKPTAEMVDHDSGNSSFDRHATDCPGPLGSAERFLTRAVPAGYHLSNTIIFTSGKLGLGLVSIAKGYRQAGIVLSVILMILCAWMICFSYYLLGKTCEMTGFRSWESASRGILGRGFDYFVVGVLIFYQMGSLTSFVISIHDLLGPFLEGDHVSPFLKSAHGQRLLTAAVWFFGMFLLALPRRVGTLRYFSLFGVSFIFYFVFVVILRSSMHGLPHLHEMNLVANGLDAVNGLTLFIFAFLGHGLCFRIYDEMPQPSAFRLAIDGSYSVMIVATLYFLVGFFGYADIGNIVDGSIFKYYSVHDDILMMIAYIGIMLKLCVSYALTTHACRLPIFYVLQRDLDHCPFWIVLCVNISINLLSLVLGLFIPDVTIVFNLLGSICGGVLAFLLPVFFVLYIGGWTLKNVGPVRLGLTYLNMVAGVVAIVFGTAVTIDGIVKKYGKK